MGFRVREQTKKGVGGGEKRGRESDDEGHLDARGEKVGLVGALRYGGSSGERVSIW